MARLFTRSDGRRLDLPGRSAREIVSAEAGAEQVSLRLVHIAPPKPGEKPRGPHVHHGFEECIHVLSGAGMTEADSGAYPLSAGDTILIPAGELHATRNTGSEPLVLLCFFPVGEISSGTEEFPDWDSGKPGS